MAAILLSECSINYYQFSLARITRQLYYAFTLCNKEHDDVISDMAPSIIFKSTILTLFHAGGMRTLHFVWHRKMCHERYLAFESF